MPSPRKQRRSVDQKAPRASPWLALIYLLCFPLGTWLFLAEGANWGAIDQGMTLYDETINKTWGEVLSRVFIPQDSKVFFFGYFRPVSAELLAKTRGELLNLGAYGDYVTTWIGHWVAMLSFAWGTVSLLSRSIPFAPGATWGIAILLWLCPPGMFSAAFGSTDHWLQFLFMGLTWGLWFSDPKHLPGTLARSRLLRHALVALCALFACQSYESTPFFLIWTSCLLLLERVLASAKVKSAIWHDLAPLAVGLAYILLYRSLDPGTGNRTEIQTNYAIEHLLAQSRYYWMWWMNGYSRPFIDWIGVVPRFVGSDPDSNPLSLILTITSVLAILWGSWRVASSTKKSGAWLLAWIVLGSALLQMAPYLPMVARSMAYYAFRTEAAFLTFIGVLLHWKGLDRRLYYLAFASLVLALGLTSHQINNGLNFMRKYGAMSKSFHQKVAAMPETQECTTERPCCLNVVGSGWLYNYHAVNYNDGGWVPPRFVRPGQPCSKTLEVQSPNLY